MTQPTHRQNFNHKKNKELYLQFVTLWTVSLSFLHPELTYALTLLVSLATIILLTNLEFASIGGLLINSAQ